MKRRFDIWPEPTAIENGEARASIVIEGPAHDGRRIWFSLPERYAALVTTGGDPFVVAMIFTAMGAPCDLHVHATVSPSLLRNIAEFQSAWHCWRPEKYSEIEVSADRELESPPAAEDGAVSLFSGGVDSSFTAYSHRMGACGRRNYKLTTGLMVHGLDIQMQKEAVFARAADRAARTLASIGIDLVPMRTNIRELGEPWWDFHGAAPVSCLMLLQRGFRTGLVPSTDPYDGLILPWGSNPVTDWMMSSDSFRIVHDGAQFSRTEKVEIMGKWPEFARNLRVCLIGKKDEEDRNCGVCEKCIRTVLNFRALGLGLPESFENDVTDRQIRALTLDFVQLGEMRRIAEFTRRRGVRASWVTALEFCLLKNLLRMELVRYRKAFRRILGMAAGSLGTSVTPPSAAAAGMTRRARPRVAGSGAP